MRVNHCLPGMVSVTIDDVTFTYNRYAPSGERFTRDGLPADGGDDVEELADVAAGDYDYIPGFRDVAHELHMAVLPAMVSCPGATVTAVHDALRVITSDPDLFFDTLNTFTTTVEECTVTGLGRGLTEQQLLCVAVSHRLANVLLHEDLVTSLVEANRHGHVSSHTAADTLVWALLRINAGTTKDEYQAILEEAVTYARQSPGLHESPSIVQQAMEHVTGTLWAGRSMSFLTRHPVDRVSDRAVFAVQYAHAVQLVRDARQDPRDEDVTLSDLLDVALAVRPGTVTWTLGDPAALVAILTAARVDYDHVLEDADVECRMEVTRRLLAMRLRSLREAYRYAHVTVAAITLQFTREETHALDVYAQLLEDSEVDEHGVLRAVDQVLADRGY